jgi:lysophospholipase L1-like esterase
MDGILGDPKLMSDEVHPNDQGYALMASRIAPVLESVIK